MSKLLTRIICVAGVLAIAGCNSPSPVQGLRVVELRHYITGGSNVMTVGAVTQTSMRAFLSDNREVDVTVSSQLMSLDTSVVTVSADGAVTAVGPGRTRVEGTFAGQTGGTTFTVNAP